MTPSLAEPPTPQRFFSRAASARISASPSGRLKTVVAVLPLRPAVSRRTLTGPVVVRVTDPPDPRALRRSPSLLDHTMSEGRLAMRVVCQHMAYTNLEGRQELLDELAGAAEAIGMAIAALGEAYEALDDATADRLEAALFRPANAASGRARRTYAEFAERHGFPPRAFAPVAAGHAAGARGHIDHAVDALRRADDELAELQDSMLPVEVGDAEVRAGITETRALLGPLPAAARHLERTLGR